MANWTIWARTGVDTLALPGKGAYLAAQCKDYQKTGWHFLLSYRAMRKHSLFMGSLQPTSIHLKRKNKVSFPPSIPKFKLLTRKLDRKKRSIFLVWLSIQGITCIYCFAINGASIQLAVFICSQSFPNQIHIIVHDYKQVVQKVYAESNLQLLVSPFMP